MLRRKRKPTAPAADVTTLPPRWAAIVADAEAVQLRWQQLVDGVRPGPVRERLEELSVHVDAGVRAVWETASGAVEASRVAEALDADRVTAEYKRVKRDPAADPELLEALQARFTSVQRVLNAIDDTDERLRLLEARLGASVARAAEVALASGAGSEELGTELEEVVSELSSLRDALASLGR